MGHTATIKVDRRGPVRVFSYFNVIFLAGPRKGEKHFETVSYIYRVDDKSFTEAWGMLENDPNPPRMTIWKRLSNKK
jgi:hypothetical protein